MAHLPHYTRTVYLRAAALALFAVLAFALVQFGAVEYLRALIGGHYLLSALAFLFLMFIATVIAPVAILPAVPAIALVLGALETALLSVAGWSAGAIIAFLVARHLGRPVAARFVSLETLERYERMLPREATFWWLVALRIILPVDVLSYAVGLLSRMPLATYTLATVIGVTPFSFIFAYAGPAFAENDYGAMALLAAIAVVLFITAYYCARHARRMMP